ncbi:hypothetical protein QL189_21325, partial [Cronobacter turicensis]|uniref:hypothetical protein n=1 Tax=Cronobacter turicensis TaxID=413502 RepID=UPI0024ADC1C4
MVQGFSAEIGDKSIVQAKKPFIPVLVKPANGSEATSVRPFGLGSIWGVSSSGRLLVRTEERQRGFQRFRL